MWSCNRTGNSTRINTEVSLLQLYTWTHLRNSSRGKEEGLIWASSTHTALNQHHYNTNSSSSPAGASWSSLCRHTPTSAESSLSQQPQSQSVKWMWVGLPLRVSTQLDDWHRSRGHRLGVSHCFGEMNKRHSLFSYKLFIHHTNRQKCKMLHCLHCFMFPCCIILIFTLHDPNPSICCCCLWDNRSFSLLGTSVEQRVVRQLIRFDHRTERHTCSDQPHYNYSSQCAPDNSSELLFSSCTRLCTSRFSTMRLYHCTQVRWFYYLYLRLNEQMFRGIGEFETNVHIKQEWIASVRSGLGFMKIDNRYWVLNENTLC